MKAPPVITWVIWRKFGVSGNLCTASVETIVFFCFVSHGCHDLKTKYYIYLSHGWMDGWMESKEDTEKKRQAGNLCCSVSAKMFLAANKGKSG